MVTLLVPYEASRFVHMHVLTVVFKFVHGGVVDLFLLWGNEVYADVLQCRSGA